MNQPEWMERRGKTVGGPRVDVGKRIQERSVRRGDCLIWTGVVGKDGYGLIGIGRGRQYRVHRVAWELEHGSIPNGYLICHTCDTPRCINPKHLFLGTPKDNTQDMIVKQRRANQRGERHPSVKLTDWQVEQIRKLRAAGSKLNDIATLFGVSFQWVSHLYRKGRKRA